jgi:endonuclease/exonuclease/phosphatase family metal-dependent hydrolase
LAIPAGSTFSGTGVLGFEFSGYEFWPTSLTVTSENTLPRAVRARNTGESTIATLNMFRFFDDVNDPPSQDALGRTRDDEVVSTAEYGRRRAKLARYILEVLRAPDILAVQEAEKKEVLDSLAADIKQLDGAVAYSAFLVEGNDVGTIDVGFLVRNTVTVNSVTQLGKTDIFTFDGSLLHDRPPLLLDANLADGCAISVLCVHQRSLGGIDDPVDGNRVRQKRHAQAVSVANMVQSLQTGKPFINLVVTGDFNAFQFTDGYVDVLGQIMGTPADASQALIPGTDVVNPDLTNQVLALPEAERYSFNFGGSAQVLDHMLVSQTLNPAITGRAYARGNSDAAINFINDGSTVLRASDHDGLVLYITPIPVIADAGADQEICSGASTTIGGSPTGAGGAGTLTFSWSPTTGLDDPTKANPTVTLTATTTTTLTYTVTVTDANNCKATDEATVTVNPLPNAAAGADLSICFAQTVKLGGNPTGSGGTGALTFSWTAAPADPSLSDPSVANPTARPAATTTYTVEVTDAKGCKATDQITVTVHRFVLLSDGYIRFNQNKISSGDIHSNKKIEFGVGAPGTHTGNLTALDDITIRNKNTITGNATANDELYLFGNATVTGAKIDHANLPPVVLSPVAFAAGGPNKTVPPNGAMSLAPGSYGTVQVGEKATLLLSAGDYFMRVLDTDPAAILSINVADGPVNVHVTKDLCFDERVKVKITGAGAATDKVTFITLQDPKVDVGKRATIQGTLIAQNSQVHFSNGCKVKGAVCADDGISVDAGVTFNFHSPGVLAKFADEESEAGESEAVTSYQLEQNYPNPFNPSTQIKFSVLEAGVVHLSVYNLQGQLVRTLVSGEMNPGHHAITWNGRDDGGRLAPSGVYLYKLRVNGFEKTRKMTLMK